MESTYEDHHTSGFSEPLAKVNVMVVILLMVRIQPSPGKSIAPKDTTYTHERDQESSFEMANHMARNGNPMTRMWIFAFCTVNPITKTHHAFTIIKMVANSVA